MSLASWACLSSNLCELLYLRTRANADIKWIAGATNAINDNLFAREHIF